MASPSIDEVLSFWFSERAKKRWFASDPAFDDEIRSRFGTTVTAAGSGALDAWAAEGEGALALIILLDQFPRNMHRGTPRAFEHDHQARRIADLAVGQKLDLALPLDRRMFLYLPFEHSESRTDQERSVALFSRWAAEHEPARRADADEGLRYAVRHQEIIERFGRFPHRNAILGRSSTVDELAFLEEPDSSF